MMVIIPVIQHQQVPQQSQSCQHNKCRWWCPVRAADGGGAPGGSLGRVVLVVDGGVCVIVAVLALWQLRL
jgi:hypothetical protein